MPLPKLKAQEEKLYTVGEYLERERAAVQRSEYFDGAVYLMAGESDEHGIISVNLTVEFGSRLKGKNRQVRTKNAKIKSGGFDSRVGHSTKGMFSYPDLVVICGAVKYHDKKKDVILNPKLIIEVLSDSTRECDRNDKFVRCRMFSETLTDYDIGRAGQTAG